tara:strand:- start:16 stop:555 length:540 start_codon:yes stop_codon:yes gene_type:complete
MRCNLDALKEKIRNIPDFPIPGINFKDVTTLFKDSASFRMAVDRLAAEYADKPIDLVAGIEARGFMLAPVLAYLLNKGFVPLRKSGKLPAETRQIDFKLEYGTANLEIHLDALQTGTRVLVVDDLLATGGTAAAACQLVEDVGGVVAGVGFLIELSYLGGRQQLGEWPIFSLLKYESEA